MVGPAIYVQQDDPRAGGCLGPCPELSWGLLELSGGKTCHEIFAPQANASKQIARFVTGICDVINLQPQTGLRACCCLIDC